MWIGGNVLVGREGALGGFGDVRRAAMGTRLIERVMETGSLVVRKLGRDRAGEIAIHRFLSAASVTCGEMVATLATRTAAACAGRRIVAAQDTTEINFAGREERRRGLGPAGDGMSAGWGRLRIRPRMTYKPGGGAARARLVISPMIPRLAWPAILP